VESRLLRLDDRALNRATLARQLLLDRHDMPVVKTIEQVLALQAQVPRPPHIALWSRLRAFERGHLHVPLRKKQLVRATAMRGTLHIMSARDFLAFRGALQPQLSAGRVSITGKSPLPPLDRLVDVARTAFGDGAVFNDVRAALVKTFPKHHDRMMGYAVRMELPLVQVPTSLEEDAWGFPSDACFAPADAWLGKPVGEGRGPAALIERYLAAFGPATAADIQCWTGLKGVAALLAPMRAKLALFQDARGRELFDLPKAPRPAADTPAPVRFLPEYDSVILAHADRSRLVDEKHRKALVTKNLIVPPTFLVDGRVSGTWKIEVKRGQATLRLSPFAPLARSARRALEAEGAALVRFAEPGAILSAVVET
jgi:hypothetical protein